MEEALALAPDADDVFRLWAEAALAAGEGTALMRGLAARAERTDARPDGRRRSDVGDLAGCGDLACSVWLGCR